MTHPNSSAKAPPIELPVEGSEPLDPPSDLQQLREREAMCPLRYPDGHLGWLSTRYALGREILCDPRFSVRLFHLPIGDGAENAEAADAMRIPELETGSLLALDPARPVHLRRRLAGYLTVRRVAEHRAAIKQIVEERLDTTEAAANRQGGKPVDLVEEFALPVPSTACSNTPPV